MTFNYLDIALLIILLLSLIGGLVRGILKSVSWLPGIALGLLAAVLFNKALTGIILEYSVLSPMIASAISVVSLVCVTYFIVRLIFVFFSSALESIGLGAIDKVLGGIFSLLLSIMVLGMIYTVICTVSVASSVAQYMNGSFIIKNIINPVFSQTVEIINSSL